MANYHYVFIVFVIIVIIVLQISFFLKNRKKQKELQSIFPSDCNSEISVLERNGISVIIFATEEDEIRVIENKLKLLEKELERKQQLQEIFDNNLTSYMETEIEQIKQLTSKRQKIIERLKKNAKCALNSNGENNIIKPSSPVFNNIILSINDYLAVNKGAASDFHLIKDVVDRNCDSVEEEIATLTPIPLYLGLIGTMLGILVGVGFLVFSGGIDALLSTQVSQAGSGIVELLGGVALAMGSSIVGILLTTTGSYYTKESKNKLNCNKNAFLSWIQVKLLPTLSGNATTAIYTLQQNLSTFNNTFASNIKEMGTAFSATSQSHQDQLKLMQLVERMDVTRMAKANVSVLQELQKNTQEFSKFNEYLHSVTGYLEKVQTLSLEVNEHLNRTKAIEDMGVFFKDEIQQIDARKGAISRSVGAVDIALQIAISKMQESAEQQLNEFVKFSVIQHEKISKTVEGQQEVLSSIVIEQQGKFSNAIDEQKTILQQRMEETSLLIEELKNLSAVKASMSNIEKATTEQNKRIEGLTSAIEKMAQMKVDTTMNNKSDASAPFIGRETEIPKWIKVSMISAMWIISAAGLIFIIIQIVYYADLFI